ncbi:MULTISPECIES: hypothetical protein [Amycolatopsis]|nr:hypothetical protein [Amycolatopsis bullii]
MLVDSPSGYRWSALLIALTLPPTMGTDDRQLDVRVEDRRR